MDDKTPALSPAAVKAGWGWIVFEYTLLPNLVGLLDVSSAWSNFWFHAASALVTGLIFREALAEGLRRGKAQWKRFSGVCALALLGYFLAGWAVSSLIGWLVPDFVNQNDQVLLRQQWVLLFVTTVVLAPLSEECLFRGLLFSRLAERNRGLAYLLSSLCFGLIHVLGFLYSPMQFALALLQYLPAGLILAWAQERFGLLAPICIHAAINAISMVRVLLSPL